MCVCVYIYMYVCVYAYILYDNFDTTTDALLEFLVHLMVNISYERCQNNHWYVKC